MSRGSEYPDSGRRYEDSGDDALADVLNGFSLDSRRKRKRKEDPEQERAERERAERQQAEQQRAEQDRRDRDWPDQPPQQPPPQQPPPRQPDLPQQQADEPEPQEQRSASSVRSYTWTGGRTRSTHEFQLETLVSAGEGPRPGTPVRLEHQSIVDLCGNQPRSVAEVGALLSVPVGVTRVLLADMAELGLITVHQTVSESGSAPNMVLMERVLSGLRRL